MDLQPNAFFSSILVLFWFRKEKLPTSLYLFAIPFLFSICLVPAFPFTSYSTMRSVANYGSLFFIASAVFLVLKNQTIHFRNWLLTSIAVWGVIGAIQMYWYPKIVFALMSRGNYIGQAGRGVEGLAAEPTNYGLVLLFFFLLLMVIREKKIWPYLLVLGQLFFLAKSAMAILLLCLFVPVFILVHLRLWMIGTLSVSTLLLAPNLFQRDTGLHILTLLNISGTRAGALYEKLLRANSLEFAINLDQSVNERASHIIFACYGFLQSFPYPNGFSNFSDFFRYVKPLFAKFIYTDAIMDRIMSGTFGSLYELGAVALLYPIGMAFIVFRANVIRLRIRAFIFIALQLMLITNVQLGLPFLGLTLGLLLTQRKTAQAI
jgi:hypothetical protein